MDTGKRGFYDTQNDVHYKGDTKTKQRRAGIAQGVYFRIQMLRQMLKSGFDCPAISI